MSLVSRQSTSETRRAWIESGPAFKRIDEGVSEKLDCLLPQFFVLRHFRGTCVCACCQPIRATAMPARSIDVIPASEPLPQFVVATHGDYLPLYRQEEIYVRPDRAWTSTDLRTVDAGRRVRLLA